MKKLISTILILALLLCSLVIPALGEKMYLIQDSDSRKLTKEELWQWDYESLGYILNEIFARHGYNFIPGEKYDYYFRCMPWYTPNADSNNQRACYPKLNSIEWYNEGLVKEVRNEMRATKNYNKKGKSVWDTFSTGFDVLQGFDYVELKTNQTLPVYSAPSTNAWRGANGKAAVSTNGAIYADGNESGWLLVMYETNNGAVRVGYVNRASIKGKVTGDTWNSQLAFAYLPATVQDRVSLTDDPATVSTSLLTLQAGDTVTYLTTYFNRRGWDYIETTLNGQTVRGFIPAGSLDYLGADTDDIGKDGENLGNG